MRSRWVQAGVVGVILAALTVVIIGLASADPGQRDRARELEQQLRCPVCKSVSVSESMSDTAQAMRRSVAEQVAAGRTDQQILDYFRNRYGQWVLLDPPARGSTLLVWVLPGVAGLAGAGAVLLWFRHRHTPEELPPETRQKVASEVERMRMAPGVEDDP